MGVLEPRSKQVPRDVQFLQGLKPHDIDLILAAGEFRSFSAKQVMTHQGEPTSEILLLCRGGGRYFFEAEHGRKLNLRPITPGSIFGGAALVSGSTYLLSSKAAR